MSEYSEETYGERVAGVYDEWFPSCDPDAITFLAELVGPGKALELGVGTGRVALPLAAKGVEVHGIDAAESMIKRLRDKPDSQNVTVTLGNFADVLVDGEFELIYVMFNTIFALTGFTLIATYGITAISDATGSPRGAFTFQT